MSSAGRCSTEPFAQNAACRDSAARAFCGRPPSQSRKRLRNHQWQAGTNNHPLSCSSNGQGVKAMNKTLALLGIAVSAWLPNSAMAQPRDSESYRHYLARQYWIRYHDSHYTNRANALEHGSNASTDTTSRTERSVNGGANPSATVFGQFTSSGSPGGTGMSGTSGRFSSRDPGGGNGRGTTSGRGGSGGDGRGGGDKVGGGKGGGDKGGKDGGGGGGGGHDR